MPTTKRRPAPRRAKDKRRAPFAKTAISVPSDILHAIDKLARKRKLTRSALFTEGARQLIDRDRRDALARQIADSYESNDVPPDVIEFSRRASKEVLRRNAW